MKKMYAIYAGIAADGFGGETFQFFDSYENEYEALNEAKSIAIQEYQSYEGHHGMLNKEECEEEGYDYEDQMRVWTIYSAIEVLYEDIISISKEEKLDLDCICNALNELNLCNKQAMEAK